VYLNWGYSIEGEPTEVYVKRKPGPDTSAMTEIWRQKVTPTGVVQDDYEPVDYSDPKIQAGVPYLYEICVDYADGETGCHQFSGPVSWTPATNPSGNGGGGSPAPSPAKKVMNPPANIRLSATTNAVTVSWGATGPYDKILVRLSDTQGYVDQRDVQNRPNSMFEFTGLRPGAEYHVGLKGCDSGLLGSTCGPWSADASITTTPTARPLPKPVLRTQPSARAVHLAWENALDGQQRALLTDMTWYRNGEVIYEGVDSTDRDDGVQPNSGPYRYKLCIQNPVDEQCSDDVSASPTPTTPTAPVQVTATTYRVVGGGQGPLTARWVNLDTPGRFFSVERLDRDLLGGRGPEITSFWHELTRISAANNASTVSITQVDELGVEAGTQYRVCALVPALGAAGTVCSVPVTRTMTTSTSGVEEGPGTCFACVKP
jgi:hypothetical protein